MALRAGWSYDHIDNILSTNSNWTAVKGELPFDLIGYPNATHQPSMFSGGWLTSGLSNSSNWISWGLKSSSFLKDTPPISWYGVRIKLNGIPGQANQQTLPVMILGAVGYVAGGAYTQIINAKEVNDNLVNGELYLEVGLDWANGIAIRRFNGVEKDRITVVGITAQFAARNISIQHITALGNNMLAYFRDHMWIDNVEGQGLQGPIGPQKFVLLDQTIDTPSTWVQNTGNLQDVLKTKITNAAAFSPNIADPEPVDPLMLSLAFPANTVDGNVTALVGLVAAGLDAGSGSLSTVFEQGGQSSVPALTPITSGVIHQKRGVVSERAPDGNRWSMAKVTATKVNVDLANG